AAGRGARAQARGIPRNPQDRPGNRAARPMAVARGRHRARAQDDPLLEADGRLSGMTELQDALERALGGGPERHHEKSVTQHKLPMIYLVDSAGARITDQVQMFPGRRGAGRIFYNEVKMSGVVPQVCVLFGPSAAGGAYIPAFCDVVIMREGNASMYLGSPRMAEMVIGEKVSLEEMGGAKMHTGISGVGHFLVGSDEDGIDLA